MKMELEQAEMCLNACVYCFLTKSTVAEYQKYSDDNVEILDYFDVDLVPVESICSKAWFPVVHACSAGRSASTDAPATLKMALRRRPIGSAELGLAVRTRKPAAGDD